MTIAGRAAARFSRAAPFALAACVAPSGVAACAARAGGVEAQAPAAAADRAEVSAALDDFHDAAARADEARYFGHFAKDGVFLGTDATERWDVAAFRAYAHPHFANGKAWSFHAVRRAIAIAGGAAWFDEDLATEKLGPARGSGVLVREGGAWKIAQYNLTIPIPNDRFAAVRGVIAGSGPATRAEPATPAEPPAPAPGPPPPRP